MRRYNSFPTLLSVAIAAMLFATTASRAEDEPKRPAKKQSSVSLLDLGKLMQGVGNLSRGGGGLDLGGLLKNIDKLDPEKIKLLIEALQQANEAMGRFDKLHGDVRQTVNNLPVRFSGCLGGVFGVNDSPRLGAALVVPGATLVDQLGITPGIGLVVDSVREGSPAAQAGLRTHDILLSFAGKPVPSSYAVFEETLAPMKAGTKCDCIVMRRGKQVKLPGLVLPEVQVQDTRPVVELNLPLRRLRFPRLQRIVDPR